MKISVITINNANETWCLCMKHSRSKWHLVYVSLIASYLICGQTNYYITVSQPVVNWVKNGL